MSLLTAWLTILSVVFVSVLPSYAENTLNVRFGRKNNDGANTMYFAMINANKEGATAASLTTPFGTYPFMNLGPYWIPDYNGSFDIDHSVLPWADLETLIASEWVLIWDEGLATQTTAQIGFDPLSESDFAPIPILTHPLDGENYPSGVSLVEWNYGAFDPCADPVGEIRVMVYAGAGGYQEFFGPLNCDVTSVVCSIPSFENQHIVLVDNVINQQASADGIGGPISGDPWILENEYWLLLDSRDRVDFTGPIVEVESLSFGSLKAFFR